MSGVRSRNGTTMRYCGHSPVKHVPVFWLVYFALLIVAVLANHQVIGAPSDRPVSLGWTFVLDVVAAAFTFIGMKFVLKLPVLFELTGYLIEQGLWYLVPEVFVLIALGALLGIAAASPIISPFVYILF
jgi:hypothetical protein